MRKATERYNTKVEIPICIILDTIFNSYNNDVELLCRQALKYGFVDFDDKTKKYVLQKDYKEQDLYTVLDKEERKQYDLENELIEKGKKLEKEYRYLQQENKQLKERIDKAIEYIKTQVHRNQQFYEMDKDNLLEILGDKENE